MTTVETSDASRVAESARDTDLLLELTNISKRFPGVVALEGVDFELRRGEVHVLFGENGAGKSTLINIIAGTYPADTGTFKYRGKEIVHLSPHGARVVGISPVFQEFSLVPELTVEENLFLGRELTAGGFLNRHAMRTRARAVLRELNFDLRPDYKVAQLSRAHQQMVEIAKAFLTEVRLLILDEPTASLTDAEAANLFDLIAKLKAAGVGIIFVSHRMREIKQIGDRITVLRDGHKIKTVAAGDVSETELVELMTGRKIGVLFPKIEHKPGDKLLEVERVNLADRSVNDVSFYARAGEITGIAGLVGCGKSEIIRAIVGLEPIESGTIRVRGTAIAASTPAAMTKLGVCYFPSDRVAEGLALARPVRENVSMAALDLPGISRRRILQRRSERRIVQGIVEKLSLRPPLIERAVASFSGGNRQKVLLARGLTRDISVYLFDEPTVGVDVGAKAEIYELIQALLTTGVAIVLVSSDLPEVLNLSHRLYVMHRSYMAAELTGADINEPAVLAHFFRERPTDGIEASELRARHTEPTMGDKSSSDDAWPTSVVERIFRSYYAAGFLPVLLTVLLVAFALFVPNFVAVQNLLNVLRSSSYLVIIAAGQMLVLIVGGFDLSQGAVLALTSVSSALVMVAFKETFANEPNLIILVGVLAGLGCGAIVGLVNGACVAFLRISPFMVTLATMSIATGCALLLTSGIPVYGMPKSYVEGFGRGLWLDLPTAFYLAATVVAVILVMQYYTRMGRYILAIGGNIQAAIVSGVPAKTYLILSYVICSMLASVSGLAFTAELGSGQAVINAQLTLESIAAAVIAGVSIKGGVGRVEMVALGAILLLTLTDAMDLLRIDPRIQAIFLGIIVVLAVALDELSRRRAALV